MLLQHLTIWAVIAAGKHLFPFRTEKLSPLAPMVLGEQSPGRVGRRPFLHDGLRRRGPSSFLGSSVFLVSAKGLRRRAACRAIRGRGGAAGVLARRRADGSR